MEILGTVLTILGGGGTLGLLGLLANFLLTRGGNKNKAAEIESARVQGEFSRNLELTKYVDSRVDLVAGPLRTTITEQGATIAQQAIKIGQLEADAVERDQTIADLREELGTSRERETNTTGILRRFFQKLRDWNTRGMKGPMPMPSIEDMEALDLSEFANPITPHTETE